MWLTILKQCLHLFCLQVHSCTLKYLTTSLISESFQKPKMDTSVIEEYCDMDRVLEVVCLFIYAFLD